MATASKSRVIEVEVSGLFGRGLHFRPIGRTVRGRMDPNQIQTETGRHLRERWPTLIPGQVLGIDTTSGEKYLREPLHDQEHGSARRLIEKRGRELPKERETFDSESTATWVYWLKRAVDAGQARVISGDLDSLDLEDGPRKNFIFAAPKPESAGLAECIAGLAKAVEAQGKVLEALLSRLK
jgi:hypothetical protein